MWLNRPRGQKGVKVIIQTISLNEPTKQKKMQQMEFSLPLFIRKSRAIRAVKTRAVGQEMGP